MNRFQTWYSIQPAALRALLTINVVIYALWIVAFAHIEATATFVFDHLALFPKVPEVLFEPWQLLTYNFLHLGDRVDPGLSLTSFLHILFNMLWLVWIGREYEELHGSHRLLSVYLIAGVGGGLVSMVLFALTGVGAFGGLINGASASVLGVMAVVATTYPHKKIGLFLLGPIRLVYLVVGFLVLDLLFLSGGGTAVGAHLGGALFGFLFAKGEERGLDLSSWARFLFQKRSVRRMTPAGPDKSFLTRLESWLSIRGIDKSPGESPAKDTPIKRQARSPFERIRAMRATETEPVPLEEEVDRILDKISEQGYDSLTEEEKRILYEASRR